MNTKKILYYILMFLPLLAVIIALPFLPEKIPAHYGLDGQVTRWGSKYETLLFPGTTILFGAFILSMAKIAAKQEGAGQNNSKITIVSGIAVLALFNALTGYALYADFHKVQDLAAVPVDLTQMVFGILGVLMLIVGNIMPKVKMNSVIGLRTPWSRKNEIIWKKCQRFAGISSMTAGVLILAVSLLTKSTTCWIASIAILFVQALIDAYYSYRTAKKN